MKKRVTIADLEKILDSNEEKDIEINPDGSIHAVPKGTAENAKPIILTHKYASAEFY